MSPATHDVSLREVTDANRGDVEQLRVAPHQDDYVASVSRSFVDAAENPDAHPWYRVVYSGSTPVGFVMIADGVSEENPDFAGPYYLWRLLIDQRWQGQGIGRAALDLVVDYVRTRPGARTLQTSVAPGSRDNPMGFYLGYGFTPTGQDLDGEELLVLRLTD
jgi:diamine N-acetyltransferase